MLHRSIIFILLLAIFSPGSAQSQGEFVLKEKLQVQKQILPNGLKILTLEDHSAPLVSFQMWVHTGSKNERPGITGISHLFEHMMFKGSKKYGPEQHAQIIKKNGGNCNAYTAEDVTVYFENIVPDKLELVVSMEAERLANLALTDAVLKSEREVVREERRVSIDNSNFGLIFEQLLAAAYTAHPYGWTVIGWMSDLEAITLADCQEYHRIHYAPNNVTIAMVGDFKTDEAVSLVQKYFGHLRPQEEPPKIVTREPEQKGERIAYVHHPAQLPILMSAYHIPETGHKDIFPLQVLQMVLSSGESSRLYQKMVYQEQVAIYAGGGVDEREDPGIFYLYCGMSVGHNIDEGKEMLFAEVDKFATELITDDELQKAKNQLEANFIHRLQTDMSKASTIASYEVLNGDFHKIFEDWKNLNSVTREDVMRVAKQYLIADNRTTVILVPEQNLSN